MFFADAHCHANSVKGLGAKGIAEKFKKHGGWFIAFIGLSPWHYGLIPTYENYIKTFHHMIRENAKARRHVKTACLLGFHPADLNKLVDIYGLKAENAFNLAIRVLDYVLKLCKEGIIDGIGEIGRPHYKVDPKFVIANELIMEYVFKRISEERIDCIIHLHLEQGGRITVESIKNIISRYNVARNIILFHHSKPGLIEYALEERFPASLPGIKELILWGTRKLKPAYVFESDFLDDPSRPGTVVYPWVMVNNQCELLNKDSSLEEYFARINVDNIARFYKVEPP